MPAKKIDIDLTTGHYRNDASSEVDACSATGSSKAENRAASRRMWRDDPLACFHGGSSGSDAARARLLRLILTRNCLTQGLLPRLLQLPQHT